jgi:hypothetical protein
LVPILMFIFIVSMVPAGDVVSVSLN